MPSTNQPVAAASKRQTPTSDYLNWHQLDDAVLICGLTAEQVLSCSTTTRWRFEKRGKLRGVKVGASKRYRVGDVRALLAELTQGVKSHD